MWYPSDNAHQREEYLAACYSLKADIGYRSVLGREGLLFLKLAVCEVKTELHYVIVDQGGILP